MVLEVTSTCDKSIEIGFPGQWFLSYAPANAEGSTITVTDKWQDPTGMNLRLESRTACAGKSLTIHSLQFVEGSKNCFDGGIFNNTLAYSFVIKSNY